MFERPFRLHTVVLTLIGAIAFADLAFNAATRPSDPTLLLDPIKDPASGNSGDIRNYRPSALALLPSTNRNR